MSDEDSPTDDLLLKADADLTEVDFVQILHAQPVTDSETYKTHVYFLPLAMAYVHNHGDSALDAIRESISFLMTHEDSLRQDGLLPSCRDALVSWLTKWTETFAVLSLNETELSERGSPLSHLDYVLNSCALYRALGWLRAYEAHNDLVTRCICTLLHFQASIAQTAWYLEIAREYEEGWRMQLSGAFGECFFGRALQRAALRTVMQSAEFADVCGTTYWRDMQIRIHRMSSP